MNTKKGRLFVDMDGTLAEWRTLTVNSEEELKKILSTKGYFAKLIPYQNVVDAVRIIIKETDIPVFIASCYMPMTPALADKNIWLNRYLPEIDRRIFIPDGESKAAYVPGGVRENDVLLDDYTRNLTKWPGQGIKLLNPVNHTRQTWTGPKVDYQDDPQKIAEQILKVLCAQ